MRLPQEQIDKAFATLNKTIEAEAVEVISMPKPMMTSAVNDVPDLKIMTETDDDRFERWLALDSRYKAGESLDSNDFDFHELFALSKTWRIKMAQHEAHLEQLEREEEIAKRLSK